MDTPRQSPSWTREVVRRPFHSVITSDRMIFGLNIDFGQFFWTSIHPSNTLFHIALWSLLAKSPEILLQKKLITSLDRLDPSPFLTPSLPPCTVSPGISSMSPRFSSPIRSVWRDLPLNTWIYLENNYSSTNTCKQVESSSTKSKTKKKWITQFKLKVCWTSERPNKT